MPETRETVDAAERKSTPQSRQVEEMQAEIDRLQRELDDRSNEDVRTWLKVVGEETRMLARMTSTLSWRITRPLRLARTVQIKMKEIGLVRTSQLAVADLRRRYAGRRR
jgi:hypothetical protein